jgi:hypothetical protein
VEAAPKLQCCTASLPSLSTSSPFRWPPKSYHSIRPPPWMTSSMTSLATTTAGAQELPTHLTSHPSHSNHLPPTLPGALSIRIPMPARGGPRTKMSRCPGVKASNAMQFFEKEAMHTSNTPRIYNIFNIS